MRRSRASLIILVLVLLPSCDAIRGPKFVAKITIVNPFEYSFLVEVGDGHSGWLNLGGVERESEETTQEVIDMGTTWVFRFSFRDQEHEQVTLSRAELAANRWRVTVPETIAQRLRARGEPPSFKA